MSKRLLWSGIVIVATLLSLAGAMTRQAQAAPALVKTASAQMLVDAKGMTLYMFTEDKHGKSMCTGACAQYWPPALVAKGASIPASISGISGTFGSIMRSDGSHQLTYDGAPLYTFVKDKKPGDVSGQGVDGIWWAVLTTTPHPAAAAAPPAKSGW